MSGRVVVVHLGKRGLHAQGTEAYLVDPKVLLSSPVTARQYGQEELADGLPKPSR
jgi:hypothetical protein